MEITAHNSGATAIVPSDQRPWMRLPEESVPGDINMWGETVHLTGMGAVWDVRIESLAAIASLEQLQVAKKQAIEQSDSRLAPDKNRMNPVMKVS